MQRADHVVLSSCAVLVATALAVVWVTAGRLEPPLVTGFCVALAALPFAALLRLRQGAMRGLHHAVMAQIPRQVVRPLVFLILVIAAYLALGEALSAPVALALYAGAMFVAFVLATGLRRTVTPSEVKSARPQYHTGRWLREALPLLLSGGLVTVSTNLDVIMLGILQGSEQVGQYSVAKSIVGLILVARRAINAPFGPTVASLYSQQATDDLQAIVTKSARAVLAVALPVALVCIFFGEWILQFFGPEFTRAATVLVILSLGQLFSAAMGSLNLLLQMTRHPGEAAKATMTGILVNIGLICILVPFFGMEGAAIAVTAGLIARSVMMALAVRRRLGLSTTAWGRGGS